MSYRNDNDRNPAEYGGGGSSGDNYYDSRAEFSSSNNRRDDGEYGNNRRDDGEYRDTRYDDNSRNRYASSEDDYSPALSHARQHGQDKDSSLFSEALSFLNQNKSRFSSNNEVDESQAVSAHQSLYGGGGGQDQRHDSQSLGAGAAMEALKMFTSSGSGGSGLGGGGDDKNKFIGMAMAQAGKLWENKVEGGGLDVAGDKQSTINSAAEMALKMYMKNQGGSGLGGTGGPGGLLSLAGKFL